MLLGRDVVKLITPGTLIEPLDNEANYLLCLSTGPGSTVGLAWIDISTGEFQVCMLCGILITTSSSTAFFFAMILRVSKIRLTLMNVYLYCNAFVDIII